MTEDSSGIRIEGHRGHSSRRTDGGPDGLQQPSMSQMDTVEIPDRDSKHEFLHHHRVSDPQYSTNPKI